MTSQYDLALPDSHDTNARYLSLDKLKTDIFFDPCRPPMISIPRDTPQLRDMPNYSLVGRDYREIDCVTMTTRDCGLYGIHMFLETVGIEASKALAKHMIGSNFNGVAEVDKIRKEQREFSATLFLAYLHTLLPITCNGLKECQMSMLRWYY